MNEIPGIPKKIVPDRDENFQRYRSEQERQVNALRGQMKTSQQQIDEMSKKIEDIIQAIEILGGSVG